MNLLPSRIINSIRRFFVQIALACIGFTVYRTLMTEQKLDELLGAPNEYANFEFLSFAQNLFNDAIAIMVFVAWIKVCGAGIVHSSCQL